MLRRHYSAKKDTRLAPITAMGVHRSLTMDQTSNQGLCWQDPADLSEPMMSEHPISSTSPSNVP